jgi:hypothetical protein
MTSTRPRFFFLFLIVVLISGFKTSAFAADDKAQSQSSASLQNQTADPALFGQPGDGMPASSDLFFLKNRPRLNLSSSTAPPPKSAILKDADCYTMRMYKVKRKEHFANGENGLRGYSTCELASNYQVRSAIAHVETAEDHDARSDEPPK